MFLGTDFACVLQFIFQKTNVYRYHNQSADLLFTGGMAKYQSALVPERGQHRTAGVSLLWRQSSLQSWHTANENPPQYIHLFI